jgi:hypothetical protein
MIQRIGYGNNPNWRWVVVLANVAGLFDSLLVVLTLGALGATWQMDVLVYFLKRQVAQAKRKEQQA